jgi:transcriptional regulator with XRE-family HTH domain
VQDLPADDTWILERRRAIGARVREERRRQGLTQDDVWMAAHLNRWTVQRLEAGEEVKMSTLLRVAWVLNVPLAELVR